MQSWEIIYKNALLSSLNVEMMRKLDINIKQMIV